MKDLKLSFMTGTSDIPALVRQVFGPPHSPQPTQEPNSPQKIPHSVNLFGKILCELSAVYSLTAPDYFTYTPYIYSSGRFGIALSVRTEAIHIEATRRYMMAPEQLLADLKNSDHNKTLVIEPNSLWISARDKMTLFDVLLDFLEDEDIEGALVSGEVPDTYSEDAPVFEYVSKENWTGKDIRFNRAFNKQMQPLKSSEIHRLNAHTTESFDRYSLQHEHILTAALPAPYISMNDYYAGQTGNLNSPVPYSIEHLYKTILEEEKLNGMTGEYIPGGYN